MHIINIFRQIELELFHYTQFMFLHFVPGYP